MARTTRPGSIGNIDRLAAVAAETCRLTLLAWACLPNHAHCLFRTGPVPVATAMRRLLTGYATAFNRRRGHLFQSRYRPIVVEADPHLPELTRCIHLNPVRAGLVPTLAALARSPWTGHSALLGRVPRNFQPADCFLEHTDDIAEFEKVIALWVIDSLGKYWKVRRH